MGGAVLLGVIALSACASQSDLNRAEAQMRAMRREQMQMRKRMRGLEAQIARQREGTEAEEEPAGSRRAPVEHVVVIRVEPAPGTEARVNVSGETPDEPTAEVRELIPPWPAQPRPRPDVGTIRVGARGFYCAASIDGIPIGNTPMTIRTIRSGIHDVECVNDRLGYRDLRTVTVEAGQRTTVIFER